MYAHKFINIIQDDIAVLEEPFELPARLELRFAEEADQQALRLFVEANQPHMSDVESFVIKGHAVILYAPEQQKVYGCAVAQKVPGDDLSLKIHRPFSVIPWVGLNQMMVAALRLKQKARKPGIRIVEENYGDWGIFESDQDAESYLKRLAHMRAVVSSGRKMALDISPALETIRHIKDIRLSLLLRCGGARC